MDREGWSLDWDAPDLEAEVADGASSGFEAIRAFEFGFQEPSTLQPIPEELAWPPSRDDESLTLDWSTAKPIAGPATRPNPRGPRRPEIPGYEILEELGRGAMGVVYRALQTRLNREVALKMILAGDHASPDTLARFVAEAETIARLKHPNIVQIYGISDWEGRPYVELEYVEGGSLASRLDGTPWPPRTAARLLEHLSRAAAEAHRLGIVHRDLKPANILMTVSGEPKISDFGLAKTLEANSGLTQTESIMGSPNYMAPEQADGHAKDVGPSADIYALGANLYELLTGRPPFVAPTILATLDLVKNSEPVPLRRLQPFLPRDLETICLKCLEKDPGARYASADNLADDLAAFLDNKPITARRSFVWERSWKWCRRHPSSTALILITTLASLGAAGAIESRREEVARLDALSRQNASFLGTQVDRHVLLGRDAMHRGEWEAARTQVTTALSLAHSEARLAGARNGLETMLERCDRKIVEQHGYEAARGRFANFQRFYDEAIFYQSDYTGLDPEANIRASRTSAARALAEFGLGTIRLEKEGDPAILAPDARHFDARELEKINIGCYELILLQAESVSHVLPGEDRARQVRQSLEILDSARRLRGITPAFHLRRAAALERSGDGPGAKAERRLAEKFPTSNWSAVDHFLTGEQAYRRKDLRLAIESFRRALSIQPDRFWAHYFLAVCLLKEHRAAEAQSVLIACQSRRPDFAWTYLLKGFAEGEMHEFDLAEEDFRRANELRLNDQERYVMLVNRGVMRIRRGRNDDAVADLSGAIKLKPDQFEAYINLAMAYEKLGRWDEVLSTLGQAIAGHPSEAVLYRARSQAYRLHLRTNEALGDLRRVIELLPTDDPASAADHLEIALILQQTDRPRESLAACDRALQLKPNRAEIHRARAVALMLLRRYDEAVGSFDACLAHGGSSAALYEARGLALASHGSYERALADYTMALSLSRATPSLLANRGWVYLLSGAPAPALRDFDESLRLDSSNGHALSGRALTNVQLRKTREAISDAQASLRLNPDDSRQVYNAARVFCQAAACLESSAEKNGMTMSTADRYRNEALRLLTRALDLCPEADRSRFWEDYVRKDSSLDLIRRSRSFIDLGARAAAVRPSVVPARQGTGP
jgi:serine/threonine protein kinase/predicted Zn-dependent protease